MSPCDRLFLHLPHLTIPSEALAPVAAAWGAWPGPTPTREHRTRDRELLPVPLHCVYVTIHFWGPWSDG